ncbi:MAG: type VI secretion system baseplate subunit TssG [Chitinivibrionales bacterium]|nr:type VI secretion system baseplate subunit TssG [Chitinivibrionales bacterium]
MPDLITTLTKKCHEISYFQAISLLADYYRQQYNDTDPLNSGRIALRSDISFGFPGSDIAAIETPDNGESVLFHISFMGLLGVSSPLPHYFSEFCIFHEDQGGTALADFLSMFNQRIYVLFYKAWQKYASILRTFGSDITPIMEKMGLMGTISSHSGPYWKQLLAYVGLFTGICRSAEGLRTILSDFFDSIPVSICQWVGHWSTITNLKKMGKDSVLGVNAMIGNQVYNRTSKFRIVLGPLKKTTFEQFLANSPNITILKTIVSQYLSIPLHFDIEVQLEPMALVPVILGAQTSQIGISSSCGASLSTTDTHSIIIE